jgi:hypothetical protein
MIFAGSPSFSPSNNNSSTRVAFLEKTLKLTPPEWKVAPSGALAPFLPKLAFILFPRRS